MTAFLTFSHSSKLKRMSLVVSSLPRTAKSDSLETAKAWSRPAVVFNPNHSLGRSRNDCAHQRSNKSRLKKPPI